MAAAPADFRAAQPAPTKRPRGEGPTNLSLEATPDILVSTRDARKKGAVIVGFALETGKAHPRAREKLEKKGLDLIVVNDALEPEPDSKWTPIALP
jgi:phosphopantothenoylcysteine decarboxylase/phosphopantothenate--cysteine ligase